MEFSCQKEDLAKAVQIVEKAVGTKSTLPIIGNILIETTVNGIKLASNNLEIGIEVIIPATILSAGKILAPAKTLGSIVSKLPDAEVNIEIFDNQVIKINCGQSKFNIHGLAADEFLMLNKVTDGENITINAMHFKEMIRQVIFSVSLDESKHILNGVYFQFGYNPEQKEKFRMVSTDGYRLALKEGEIEQAVTNPINFVIPTKALNEVASIIQTNEEDNMVLNFSSDQVAFTYKNNYLVTRIIQGQFPDFNQVIPKSSLTKLLINRKNFLEAAERCSIIASSSANIIKLELSNNKLLITARTPDVGEFSELIDVDMSGDSETQISFNVRLLIDVLKIVSDEKVSLNFSGTLNPGVIKPEGKESYLYVIMPIRTTDNR
ncbi:MAG: DNA polymerase III subunit beta [Candidatus Margulisiibacteriota bacterium]|nr:MAG: DNA polymerase III subunit beta [Candidatus Margulisbacteria bacterium GWD2_39_127]OGI02419.1 MAG: DNA polymerase III subunit beta [Candidatus Margulisbacteria bacterium GWF2_38_17]OGI08552.1 MAG: DNA polymerase III subunit beta [Candidatus Margulisbacteria bacterium GWE2_39_32]PZM78205.1 MAG: DNA polymerase III subunit beta [Candidatus Margulisiibacteriota bacterium]HAR63467.1 DNA polymerase III subunit beta [Candidatus Margulisiibacteriota bacterium]